MVKRSLFVESMKSQGLRKLATVSTYDSLLRWRPWWCWLFVGLKVDVLTVQLRLWWPWLLVPFSLPIVWWLASWRVSKGLSELQIPMRAVSVRVGVRWKRPKRK